MSYNLACAAAVLRHSTFRNAGALTVQTVLSESISRRCDTLRQGGIVGIVWGRCYLSTLASVLL